LFPFLFLGLFLQVSRSKSLPCQSFLSLPCPIGILIFFSRREKNRASFFRLTDRSLDSFWTSIFCRSAKRIVSVRGRYCYGGLSESPSLRTDFFYAFRPTLRYWLLFFFTIADIEGFPLETQPTSGFLGCNFWCSMSPPFT